MNLIPQYTWQNQIVPLKAVDASAHTVTLACPLPAHSVTAGSPVRVENVPAGVTRPGTWALDTRAGTVTLWPEDGVNLARAAVTAPALPVLVRCIGSEEGGRLVRGVVFRGLTFTRVLSQCSPSWTDRGIRAPVPAGLKMPGNVGLQWCRELTALSTGISGRCRFPAFPGNALCISRHAGDTPCLPPFRRPACAATCQALSPSLGVLHGSSMASPPAIVDRAR